jgi:hypothetical protein
MAAADDFAEPDSGCWTEPIPVLHHDLAHRRIPQYSKKLAAMPVQRRTGPDHHLVDRDLWCGGPCGHPRHLPIQIGCLVR